MTDSGQLLLQVLKQSTQSAKYNAHSVVAALILFLGGSLVLALVFCFVRPYHTLIYGPKVKYPDKNRPPPPPLSRNPFSWIGASMRTTEEDIVSYVGIDAAVFIRFCKMLRNLFACMTIFICGVGIPINVYYNLQTKYGSSLSKSDALMLMTPCLLEGVPLIAHIALAYVSDILIVSFLWRNYKAVVHMRRRAFITKEYQRSLFMRTALLTEIPRKYASDQGLVSLLSQFKVTRPIQQANCGRDVKELSKLIEEHNQTVLKLESCLAKYLKPYVKMNRTKKGEALSLDSSIGPPVLDESRRPKCVPAKVDRDVEGNGKVDAIEYYLKRMQQLEQQIANTRDMVDAEKTLRYGFASYNSVADCHIVVKAAQHEQQGIFSGKNNFHIRLAPRPEDIIWKNIVLSRIERGNKNLWGNLFFIAMTIAWIVPNAFIGCFLADLSRIGALSPSFSSFMEAHTTVFAILQGILSPIVTSLIFVLLPMLIRRMSQWQGRVTKNSREKDVIRKLYVFFFFNNFLVFTLMSVVWNIVTQVIAIVNSNKSTSFRQVVDELQVGQQIANAMINASSFWAMYLLKANMAAVFDILQVISLFLKSFKSHIFAPTPRQQMEWTAPPHFDYAGYYIWLLFYATIALAFTSLQPIIFPIITLYLAFNVVLKKHTILYVYKTKAESDGSYWPLLHNRLLFAMFIGNLVILCVVWIQGGWRMAIAVAPLIVLAIAYRIASAYIFKSQFEYFIPSAAETVEIDRYDLLASWDMGSVLEERYQNPALTRPLLVPMVHARAQQFLPLVCSFADDAMFEYGNGRRKGHISMEMPRFDVIEEEDLNYERLQELNEKEELEFKERELERKDTRRYTKNDLAKVNEYSESVPGQYQPKYYPYHNPENAHVDEEQYQPKFYPYHNPEDAHVDEASETMSYYSQPPFYNGPYAGTNESLHTVATDGTTNISRGIAQGYDEADDTEGLLRRP